MPENGPNLKVISFAPNCGAQGVTLAPPPYYDPIGIVFGADGTKFVLMVSQSASQIGKNGSMVSVYANGSTSPTGQLSDRRLNYVASAVGVDSLGNVYVACCASKTRKHTHDIYVIRFKQGGSTKHGQRILLGQLGQPAGSILFDQSGNMIVPDLLKNTVNVYAPPYSGSPTVYPLKGQPWQCAFNANKTMLACANMTSGRVDLYSYPSLAYSYSLRKQIQSGLPPDAVAFAPAPAN